MVERHQWRGRLASFARMSWDEARTRGAQEITKRWDATVSRLGFRITGSPVNETGAAPSRFFFAKDGLAQVLCLLHERLPSEVSAIQSQAAHILAHRFDLLGFQNLDYGPEIDWHADVVHGKRAPRKPWYRIRLLQFAEAGDPKVTAELNRHQHLVVLAKAYCLTKEERFLDELVRQWQGWQTENPYPIGINWAGSLEVAIRSLSWLWIRHLLSSSDAMNEDFDRDMLKALALNGRHIESYLSTYFSPNTHLLGEGVGLFFIGTLCPNLRAAKRWQQLGWQIVLDAAEKQVQPDGMHFEQSIYYHVYALDFFLHARILAGLNGIPIPESFDRTLVRMLEFLSRIGQTGIAPMVGDDDGGRVFNPRRNRVEYMLDPLAIGAALYQREDFKAACPGLTEELVWLEGSEGVASFDELPPRPPSLLSRRFDPSGICIMAGAKPVPHQLTIDAGPQGAGSAGHGHADALSVQLSVNGAEWLIDSGTYCYISPGRERALFRGTSAHNTLEVDGESQAEHAGPFKWGALPITRIEQWVVGEIFDLFAGSHTGYTRLAAPVVHRRRILYLKSGIYFILDRVEGEGIHDIAQFWHLAPDFFFNSLSALNSVFTAEGKGSVIFVPLGGSGWTPELTHSKVSAAYGQSEPNLVLRFSKRAKLPAEFAVAVVPMAGRLDDSKRLATLTRLEEADAGALVRGFRYDAPDEIHYLFFADRAEPWKLCGWASDARFLHCALARPSGQSRWAMCEGSYVRFAGQAMVSSERRLARFEWTDPRTCGHKVPLEESARVRVNEKAIEAFELLQVNARIPAVESGGH